MNLMFDTGGPAFAIPGTMMKSLLKRLIKDC